jgi:triacylglycerol lipase
MRNRWPIVFVHGLGGWGRAQLFGIPYFGLAKIGIFLGRVANLDFGLRPRALFPGVGPISSNHDRACELFYQLKGGDVRYGAEHSREHGHREVVKNWVKGKFPIYPEWDEQHPIHLVGQAQGASTIRVLHHLLAQGDFFSNSVTGKRYPTNEKWVKSISSISGLHNGTPTAYVLGGSTDNGCIQRYSAAAYLASTALILARKQKPRGRIFSQPIYDFALDQWIDDSKFVYGKDNAAYDLSIHGAQILDYLEDYACTYYFSYLTSLTMKDPTTSHFVPKPGMNPFFKYIGAELGHFAENLDNLKYPITDFSAWWENDGLAPVYSQDYPKWQKGRSTARYVQDTSLRKGVWYVVDTLEMDHMNTVAFPRFTPTCRQQREQIVFYNKLYRLLASLE